MPDFAANCPEHREYIVTAMEHVPISETDPIAHTVVTIFACRHCHRAIAFPQSNFRLATKKARDAITGALTVFGYTLVEYESEL